MFAVIFEVQPKADKWDDYLSLAGQLRPELEKILGFIDNERYKSLRTEGRVLSLSTWADEKAVIRWRTHGKHHGVQEKGRFEIFDDYHLRVGEIISDTHVPPGHSLRQQRLDVTEAGVAKMVSISEADPKSGNEPLTKDAAELFKQLHPQPDAMRGIVDVEAYIGINTPARMLLLVSWQDAETAASWRPPLTLDGMGRVRHRHVRVIRDYGLTDRREAPQYYPEVRR